MSIKKISFLSAVSLAVVGSTVAFAGGPDAMAAPAPAAAFLALHLFLVLALPIMVTAVARRYLMRAFSSFLISVLSLAVFICLK